MGFCPQLIVIGSIKVCRGTKAAPLYKGHIVAVAMFFRLLPTLLAIFFVQNGSFASKDVQTLTVVSAADDDHGATEFSSNMDNGNSSSYADGREIIPSNTSSSSFVEAGTSYVMKHAFSDRMRLFFMVGLEGSGHHYLKAVVDAMFVKHKEFTYLERCKIAISCDLRQYAMGKSKYVEDMKNARHGMREVAELEKMLPLEGALVNLQGCKDIGMESFPNFGGKNKVLQYPDIRLLAEVAEAEGVDLRLVYLKRSAEEILASTTRRGFYQTGNWGPKNKADEYRRYAMILLTDLGAAYSMMSELDPRFIICFDFSLLGDPTQATKIANFTAPTPQMALALADSLVQTKVASHGQGKTSFIDPAAKRAITARLQRMMDSMEAAFCK